MSERAAVCGVDNILEIYKGMRGNSPFFSVWFNTREKAFQYNEDDMDGSLEFLQANLEAYAKTNDSNIYYLRIHSVSLPVYKNNADTVISGIPMRFNSSDENYSSSSNQGVSVSRKSDLMSFEMYETFAAAKQVPELLKQNRELLEKLTALETERTPTDTMGRITGFVESNPHVVAPLIASLGKMIAGLFPAMGGMMAGPVMAGVPEAAQNPAPMETTSAEDEAYWNRVDEALDALQQYCDISIYLPKLAIYAEKNPDMFKLMLNNL